MEHSSTRGYWISTIWPVLPGDEPFTFHVYLKKRRKTYPKDGDVVYFRESMSLPTTTPVRIFRGERRQIALRKGCGAILGRAVVKGLPVTIPPYPDDIMAHDFGNLLEWTRVIRCKPPLLKRVMEWTELSDMTGITAGQAFNLYRVRDENLIRTLESRFGSGGSL